MAADLKTITLGESVALSSPHPYGLLVSKLEDKVNIMGVSWFTFVSLKPGKMAFSINHKSYTKELIGRGAKLTLCLPTKNISDQAFACGTKTGRIINKSAELGIELVEMEGFSAPVVAESTVAWGLEVSGTVEASDHTLYIADIKCITASGKQSHVYAFDGYKRLETV